MGKNHLPYFEGSDSITPRSRNVETTRKLVLAIGSAS